MLAGGQIEDVLDGIEGGEWNPLDPFSSMGVPSFTGTGGRGGSAMSDTGNQIADFGAPFIVIGGGKSRLLELAILAGLGWVAWKTLGK